MAEAKNTFIKSKMNKDLDARLLPSGEYRNAVNVQVSRSDGEGVGSLENVLGNNLIQDFEPTVSDLSTIGYFVDEANNQIYVFLTNNGASYYKSNTEHFIYRYNPETLISEKLVEGAFLNFSKLNPIYGVNLLEDLLFWTDNRNQPRKINVDRAKSGLYYTKEENISVAKYNPYETIELFKESVLAAGQHESTMKDVTSRFLPNGGSAVIKTASGTPTNTFVMSDLNVPLYPEIPTVGDEVKYVNPTTKQLISFVPVRKVAIGTTDVSLVLDGPAFVIPALTTLVFNANPYFDGSYNGDPNFLEDKFARFSYRFKFDDNEYSIMAPFTQICFIPQQDGYFINNTLTEGDEQQAYSSTIVDFMENKVDKITLRIPLPFNSRTLLDNLHIEEIDILYKESNSLVVNVIETITQSDLLSVNSSVYEYDYQSKKPYKTLPPSEITRVYDKVPVKALSQEIISNRIVYGNFQDKTTPPNFINYNVNTSPKSPFDLNKGVGTVTSQPSSTTIALTTTSASTIEVGSIVSGTGITTGTLVTAKTNSPTTPIITISLTATVSAGAVLSFSKLGKDVDSTSIIEYPNSSLKTNRNYQVGFVLADIFGRQSTVILSSNKDSVAVGEDTFTGSTLYSSYSTDDPVSWPGDSIKVLVNDPITLNAYNGDITSNDYNPLGWYSYKIVVKQTEQEYYNVYTAGAMRGLPFNNSTGFKIPIKEKNKSFVTLINDNINKISRDLSEVGPQDKTFRSSVILYGRVENIDNALPNQGNKQYNPGTNFFTTSSVEDLYDLFDVTGFKANGTITIPITDPDNAYFGFYKSDSNPFIAEIITSQSDSGQFGITNQTTESLSINTLTSAVVDSVDMFVGAPVNSGGVIYVGAVVSWPQMPTFLNDIIVEEVEPASAGSSGFKVRVNRKISIQNNPNITFTKTVYDTIETLAIFETKPIESRLDIFWETSSAGLISNLNTLILNETNAGAVFNQFNVTGFFESAALNSNVVTGNFFLQNSFGVSITTGVTSFTLTSATLGGQPVDNYFELIGDAANGFNIKILQPFLDNVYFGSLEQAGAAFEFQFESVINGVNTAYTQTVSLLNKPPITVPAGNLIGNPIVIYSNTQTNILFTANATNGANVNNLGKAKEINWQLNANSIIQGIVPIIDYENLTTTGAYFSTNVSLNPPSPANPVESVCVIKNPQSGGGLSGGGSSSIPGDIYNIKLTAIDAGQEIEELFYQLRLGVILSSLKQIEITTNDNRILIYTVLEIVGIPSPNTTWNGFYIYAGRLIDLFNTTPPAGVNETVNIDRTNANACSLAFPNWSYGVDEPGAFNQYKSCQGFTSSNENGTTNWPLGNNLDTPFFTVV